MATMTANLHQGEGITGKEAADRIGCTNYRVLRLVATGEIRVVSTKPTLLFSREDVISLAQRIAAKVQGTAKSAKTPINQGNRC